MTLAGGTDTSRTAMKRTLGRSGIEVSALGLGCWAIGGTVVDDEGRPRGWSGVDDKASMRAIRQGLESGVTLFDTADVYGTGHSERILGKTLGADRDRVAIATKFGWTFDDGRRRTHGRHDVSPAYIRSACEASLQRLGTDRIDLYQLHVGELEPAVADEVAETLEQLLADGLIRSYGWSTDSLACAELWGARPACTAIQHNLNVFEDSPGLLGLCERGGLASVNRNPLAMGLLTGKFGAGSRLPSDDIRSSGIEWVVFFDETGAPRPEWLAKLDAIREILTSGGRTMAQGAIAWLWGRSPATIPIPGVKTDRQAAENASAMAFGPLDGRSMAEIETILGR